jgi:hypothetical protein
MTDVVVIAETNHRQQTIVIGYAELAFARSAATKQSILGRLSLLYLIIFASLCIKINRPATCGDRHFQFSIFNFQLK